MKKKGNFLVASLSIYNLLQYIYTFSEFDLKTSLYNILHLYTKNTDISIPINNENYHNYEILFIDRKIKIDVKTYLQLKKEYNLNLFINNVDLEIFQKDPNQWVKAIIQKNITVYDNIHMKKTENCLLLNVTSFNESFNGNLNIKYCYEKFKQEKLVKCVCISGEIGCSIDFFSKTIHIPLDSMHLVIKIPNMNYKIEDLVHSSFIKTYKSLKVDNLIVPIIKTINNENMEELIKELNLNDIYDKFNLSKIITIDLNLKSYNSHLTINLEPKCDNIETIDIQRIKSNLKNEILNPFLFYIQDPRTKLILYIGKVENFDYLICN